MSPTGDGTTILHCHCRAKAVPSFLSYFKTLSISLVPGNELMISCSAVQGGGMGQLGIFWVGM